MYRSDNDRSIKAKECSILRNMIHAVISILQYKSIKQNINCNMATSATCHLRAYRKNYFG